MRTHTLPLASLLLAVLAHGAPPHLAAQGSDRPHAERPNVVFMMADDHAAHALSCYGSQLNETPQLDRIAEGGMRFENCFVTNALCGPARAVILTGLYSHLNGFSRNGDRFDGSQQTFPKLFRAAGYTTAMVGKWHLESEPQGFDHWIVLPGQGAYVDPMFIDNGERRRIEGHCTDITTDLALDWLQNGRDADKPFMLMLHHKAPHRRWVPAERHRAQWEGREIPLPETFDDDWSNRASPAANTTMTIADDLTASDTKGPPPEDLGPRERKLWKQQRYMEDYLACVQGIDENTGRVLDWLDESGLADDTIVIYTSDQGFFLGDHGWFDKRFMYEESLRTPLLVRWPGVTEPGSTSDALTMNLDFAQTLLDACGIPEGEGMQGRSLVPLLRGERPDDWRQSIYYRYYEYPAVHDVRKHYGVRTDRYKLIHFHELGEWELFDLQEDPHELHNVYDDPDYADVVASLRQELHRLRQTYRDDDTVHDPRLEHFGETPARTLVDWRPDAAADGARLRDSGPAGMHVDVPAERIDGEALLLDGSAAVDLPRRRALGVGYEPFRVTARLRATSTDGVIVALGGETHGFALWLEDGVPCFGLRVEEQLHKVRADRPLPLHRESTITGALGADREVSIRVDGEPRGQAAGTVLKALPNEGLAIGEDDGSLVGDYRSGAGLHGALLQLRIEVGNPQLDDR